MKTKEDILKGKIHQHYFSHNMITNEGDYVSLSDALEAMDEFHVQFTSTKLREELIEAHATIFSLHVVDIADLKKELNETKKLIRKIIDYLEEGEPIVFPYELSEAIEDALIDTK